MEMKSPCAHRLPPSPTCSLAPSTTPSGESGERVTLTARAGQGQRELGITTLTNTMCVCARARIVVCVCYPNKVKSHLFIIIILHI